MGKRHTEKVALTSPQLSDERIAELEALFPEAVSEGKVDFEKLRAALGDVVDEGPERYSFSWAGKRNAIRLLQVPSRATLKPCEKESIDFAKTKNIFIEGENLEVLKLLFKPYFGRVKMIYIDPPYNTGNDFIYPDNFADPLDTYLKLTGQKDSEGNLLTSNPETSGRYHSAWLSMMYPRLFLARQLLRDDGVIFVSIDDHEIHNLRLLMDEVFGEENFIDNVIWKKRYGGGAKEKYLVSLHEYALLYAKDRATLAPLWVPNEPEAVEKYYHLKDEKFETRGPYRTHPLEATKSMGERKNLMFPIPAPDGTDVLPRRQWNWSKERVEAALRNKDLVFLKGKTGWTVHTKQYLKDENGTIRSGKAFSVIDDVFTQHGTNEMIDLFGDARVFPFPKPTGLITRLLNIGMDNDPESLVVDFFAGSATLADAVLRLNGKDGADRRFLLVQLPEPTDNKQFHTIAEIGKERIRRVIAKLKKDKKGKLDFKDEKPPEDLGFRVFKLAESNYLNWAGSEKLTPEEYVKEMALFADPLLPNWRTEDVIFEVAVKEAGFGLACRIEKERTVNGNTVWRVTDEDKEQSFRICLDEKLNAATLKKLELKKDELFVCRDKALDDSTAANLALQCRLKTI